MMKRSRWMTVLLAAAITLSSAMPVFAAGESAAAVRAKTDAQAAAELGVLQGEGNGVTDSYLAKATTRIQAAILFLRLKGLEQTALAYKGTEQFADADLVGDSNKPIMSYLKANPNLGWSGTGDGKFEPLAGITAQQYYKVLLEALGYKQDADFAYADALAFAKSKGLSQVAGAGALRNGHVATATVEALKAAAKDSGKSLLDTLAELKVISGEPLSLAQYTRINVSSDAALGSFLVDESGRTLYVFGKDSPYASACKDQCAVNWPVYYAENVLVSGELNAADFKTIVREDGQKQTTFKGKPLYYFIKDEKAGDVKGHGVNDVWFTAGFFSVTTASKEGMGHYIVDANGRTLYWFAKDTEGSSACYGVCETNWPIFYSEHAAGAAVLASADFGTIVRNDGTKQTTYNGKPLYYFAKDEKAGDTNGQGFNNVWYMFEIPGEAQTDQPLKETVSGYSMDIANFAFTQPVLTVEAGATITFTNRDETEHNVVSAAMVNGKPLFESRMLGKGESFTVTLDKAGEYSYYCAPHKEFMQGKIIVK